MTTSLSILPDIYSIVKQTSYGLFSIIATNVFQDNLAVWDNVSVCSAGLSSDMIGSLSRIFVLITHITVVELGQEFQYISTYLMKMSNVKVVNIH